MGLHRRTILTRPVVLVSVTLLVAGLLTGGLRMAWGTEPNLAANAPTSGSTPCAADETPAEAVTGSVADKWCSGAAGAFLEVDLGAVRSVGTLVVRHAGSGGENASRNTRDFTVSVSTDGWQFSEVVRVTGNTAGVTTHPVASVPTRWIRLDVSTPTSTTDRTARIYELEAYAGGTSAPAPPPACDSAAPATITDYLDEHGEALVRTDCNTDVAVYHDTGLQALPSLNTAWIEPFVSELWRYMKDAYGSCVVPRTACERFGDPKPAMVFLHRSAGAGPAGTGSSGTIQFRFDASTGYRATIDVSNGDWAESDQILRDVLVHQACHHPEFDGQGMLDSPAYTVGAGGWTRFCVYDYYANTGRTADAERVLAQFTAERDDLPAGARQVAWFRDWFLPLWREYGAQPDVMRRFFELVALNFPRNEYGSFGAYTRRLTVGEYVHFTSGAAGKNLSSRAAGTFGAAFDRAAFDRARRDFPGVVYP